MRIDPSCIDSILSNVIVSKNEPTHRLNWLLVSFLSHVNKNIIHSFIHSFIQPINIAYFILVCDKRQRMQYVAYVRMFLSQLHNLSFLAVYF